MSGAAVHLVALAGGSGAGKTWLAAELSKRLGAGCERLCLDDFYRDRSQLAPARRARVNFDHPAALDWPCLERVLELLAARIPALAPTYDFSTHCRRPAGHEIQPRPCVLVEGLWTWHHPRIRDLFALRIFVRCSRELRLERRLQRDTSERGRSREDVLRQFASQVEPMHQRFVEPLGKTADLVLGSPTPPRALLELERRIGRLMRT